MNVFPNIMSKNNGSVLIYPEDHLGQAGPELFFPEYFVERTGLIEQ